MVRDFVTGRTLPLEREESWVSFTSDENSRYRWPTPNILEMVLPNKESAVILFYNGTIGTAIETLPAETNFSLGLGGAATGNWITSLQNFVANKSNSGWTQHLIEKNCTSNVRLSDEDNLLRNNFSNHAFDGAGFMLGLTRGYLYSRVGDHLPLLDEFTLELWICLVNEGSSVERLCSMKRNQENKTDTPIYGKRALFSTANVERNTEFAITYDNNGFKLKWNDETLKTNLTLPEGVWTHFSVTWRNNDGRLEVFSNSSLSNYNFTVYGVQMGQQLDLTDTLAFGKYLRRSSFVEGYDFHGALDEIRLWQYAKTEQEISFLRHSKFDYYIEGLLLSMPLDQGYGISIDAWKYPYQTNHIADKNRTSAAQNKTKVQFYINKEGEEPTWLPSGVKSTPLTNHTLAFYNNSLEEEGRKICQKWFYTGNVQRLCSSKLVSQAQFYYEACLADIADGGSVAHHKLSISLFGYYCHKVLGVEKCKLHGTYDAYPPCYIEDRRDVDFPIVIVTITTVVVVVVVILCCCLVCCCMRRRKRKRKARKSDGYLDEPEGTLYAMYSAHESMDTSMLRDKKDKAAIQGDTNKILGMYGGADDEEEETGV